MSNWIKNTVSPEAVKDLCERFGCDQLTASIFLRRGITAGHDILYFMEDDKRYLNNPFLFNAMEDAVDRIKQAKDEGEKVLVFGDSDVDGITATTVLYSHLVDMGLDVTWRVPLEDDPYGLSKHAIDDFAKEYGSLIITVDCGISNNEEIDYAHELGIEVIVTDHHLPPEVLPNAAIIIDPKIENCGYPYRDISGCAVAYKLVSALRFSELELYKQEMCLLNIRPASDSYIIEAIKICNLVETNRITETIVPGMISIQQTRLPTFLQGQQILCWDHALQVKQLQKIFGHGDLINMLDVRPEITNLMPSLENASLLRLKTMSKIAKYSEHQSEELDAFYNIFVTFANKQHTNKKYVQKDLYELQLVALSTLADIMPLQNENRILVKKGLESMRTQGFRPGLQELFNKLELLGKPINSTLLSWNVNPVINSSGRLGQANLGVHLFTENDSNVRKTYAEQVTGLNAKRRELENDAVSFSEQAAYKSLEKYANKLVVVVDERIHHGVTGIVANRLAKQHNVPAVVITFVDENTAIGSTRSSCGFEVLGLLNSCSDIFLNYGGHDFAAGFSFPKARLNELLDGFASYMKFVDVNSTKEEKFIIDAELPHSFLTPEIKKTVEFFEPFGAENSPLLFLSQKTRILDAQIMGKTEKMHLKLTLDFGRHKWPAIFWGAAERLNRDFKIGDFVDIVFTIEQSLFNGNITQQLMLKECIKHNEK